MLDILLPASAHERALQEIRDAGGDVRRILVEEVPAYLVGRERRDGESAQHPNDAARFESQVREAVDRTLSETVPEFAAAIAYDQTVAPIISELSSIASQARRVVESDRPGGVRMEITVLRSKFDDSAIPARP